MSSITIQQKGILDIPADAIVNAANSGLRAGGGVCGVIFQRAGKRQLAAACKEIGHCPEGSAVNEPTGLRIPATKKGRAQSGHGLSYSLKLQLALVALLPDSHLLGILDQLVTEVGVGNGDECLGPLPGRQTLQVHLTMLGHKPVDVGAGCCNDRA